MTWTLILIAVFASGASVHAIQGIPTFAACRQAAEQAWQAGKLINEQHRGGTVRAVCVEAKGPAA